MSRVCLTIAVLGSTAYAQPNYNVELDVTAGFSKIDGGEGGLFKTVGLQLERRVTDHLRLRGVVAGGGFASFDRYSGEYLAVRAGLEGRNCFATTFCIEGGVDAAVMHMTEIEMFNPDYMLDHTSPGAFVWAGIELGGQRVRAHLAFDAGIDHHSDNAAGLLLGVSFQM